jgi:O-antigen/teichoic acid export membrane protein
MQKTWKSIVGGSLSIASGVSLLSIGLLMLFGEYKEGAWQALVWFWPYLLVFGIIPIVGGILALKRKRWLLALLSSIGGIFSFYLAIPALVLIAVSKGEFD